MGVRIGPTGSYARGIKPPSLGGAGPSKGGRLRYPLVLGKDRNLDGEGFSLAKVLDRVPLRGERREVR